MEWAYSLFRRRGKLAPVTDQVDRVSGGIEGVAEPSSETRDTENVPHNLTCPVCLGVFDEPCSLPVCGHTFCRSCLIRCATHRVLTRCPVCRAEPTHEAKEEEQLNSTQEQMVRELITDESIDSEVKAAFPKEHAASMARRELRLKMECGARELPLMDGCGTACSMVITGLKVGSKAKLNFSKPGHYTMLAHSISVPGAPRFGLLLPGETKGLVVGIMAPLFKRCDSFAEAHRKVFQTCGKRWSMSLVLEVLVVDTFTLLGKSYLGQGSDRALNKPFLLPLVDGDQHPARSFTVARAYFGEAEL